MKVSTGTLKAGETLTVEADVKNTGAVAGDEVAELYLVPPQTAVSAARELSGFQRMHLAPGEMRHVTFKLDPRTLSQVDEQGVAQGDGGRVQGLRLGRAANAADAFSGVQNHRHAGASAMMGRRVAAAVMAASLASGVAAFAEDGHEAWLRYAPLPNAAQYAWIPSRIVVRGDTATEKAAGDELGRGLSSMLQRKFVAGHGGAEENAIVIGTEGGGEQFHIATDHKRVDLMGGTPAAELYAVFHLLAEVGAQRTIPGRGA